jgi:hypothetical protein
VSLQDLGNIGELLGAIATIATLAYLAVQIRQNTRTVQAATSASVADSLSRWSEIMGSQPESARLWLQGLANPDQLKDDARLQFPFLFLSYLRRVENAYYQRRRGLLDLDVWQTAERILRRTMETPGAKHWWRVARPNFSDPFVEYIDETILQDAV